MLDKLDIRFENAINIDDIKAQIMNNNLKAVIRHFRRPKKGMGLFVFGSSVIFHISAFHNCCYFVSTNPSKFYSFDDYISSLLKLLSLETLESAKVTRLDVCIDLNEPYDEIFQRFDVAFKRSTSRWLCDSSKLRSAYFGKKPSEVIIYEKKYKNEVGVYTRIEKRVYGRNLPTRSLFGLKNSLSQAEIDKFFKHVIIIPTCITENLSRFSKADAIKGAELKGMLKVAGYGQTKRMLNSHCHFKRNTNKFFVTAKNQFDLAGIANQQLSNFFKEESAKEPCDEC